MIDPNFTVRELESRDRELLLLRADVGRQATEAARWHATAEALSTDNQRLRRALDIAVSRGCDHCAESIRAARAAATGAARPSPPE